MAILTRALIVVKITLTVHQTIQGGCLSLYGAILEILTGMLIVACGRDKRDRVDLIMWLKNNQKH